MFDFADEKWVFSDNEAYNEVALSEISRVYPFDLRFSFIFRRCNSLCLFKLNIKNP